MSRRLLSSLGLALVLLALGLPLGGNPRAAAQTQNAHGILAMEYSNTDSHGLGSLRAYGGQFTHLLPRWFHLSEPDGQLRVDLDPLVVTEAKARGLTIIPILDNLDNSGARPDLVRARLADPAKRADLVRGLANQLAEQGFGGVEVNFLELKPEDTAALTSFVRELSAALKPDGRIVSASALINRRSLDNIRVLAGLAPQADYVRALIYDENNPTVPNTAPGPSASFGFFNDMLDQVASQVPREKLLVGMSMVGADWPDRGAASEIDFSRAMALLNTYKATGKATLEWDKDAGILRLAYEDQGGVKHQAFFEDALTLSNKLTRAEARNPAGVSFFRLGSEDPSIWPRLQVKASAAAIRPLDAIPDTLPFQVLGAGEVWDVNNKTARAGQRTFTLDPNSNQVGDIRYTELPAPQVFERRGGAPNKKRIALTFEGGPDPVWTPRVLDILGENKAPATFFMVGQQALANRDLVRRVFDEKHEIGNYTFTGTSLAKTSGFQLSLELNATRYVIAGITGRTMKYLRSPGIDNPSPGLEERNGTFVQPLLRAKEFNYLTVGANIDPQDQGRASAAEIVRRATAPQPDSAGLVLVLHDSGGDRSQLLAALPAIIKAYQAQGYTFTTVSDLLDQGSKYGMPEAQGGEALAAGFVTGVLLAVQGLNSFILFMIYFSIGVGIFRVVGLGLLAVIQYKQRRPAPFNAQEIQPFVSVLVPAYNEEKVIGKTIESLLASNYRNFEILVINDGSKDRTLEVARQYAHHRQLRIIDKPNGGKSSCLNLGIEQARGEIVIAMDADTIFDPNFIPYALGHFRDPNVGGCSGNAKVGNRDKLIAQWQSIEYITSFNLDRRAYTLLNCVTVVPGAAGVWRKSDLAAVGGFGHDTLAEDADLTVNVRRLGRRIVYEDRAIAYTEAPDTIKGFLKQRRRWSYGTLQVIWKHKDTLFRPKYGALGFVAFPSALLYLFFTVVAPYVDLAAIWLVSTTTILNVQRSQEAALPLGDALLSYFWNGTLTPLAVYIAYILVEWVQSAVAFYMDRERPAPLLWVPIQRFVLRWLLYYALFATFKTALKGLRVGWGTLERRGTVGAKPKT